MPNQVHNPPRQARFHFLCPDMRIQNNSFNHVLNTIKVFENITKPSKHLSAFIKSTIDLKDCSTLLLLPVFEMSRHEKHWVFQFWLWGRFVAEKQTWVLILMSGHRPEMTFHENGERNVCELDHYADKSYLGIHYWDLCWKVAYPKLEKNWNSNVQT